MGSNASSMEIAALFIGAAAAGYYLWRRNQQASVPECFGIPLEEVVSKDRERLGPSEPVPTIPKIVSQCIRYLYKNGKEEGIFRIPGSLREVVKLKNAYDRGEYPVLSTNGPHVVAGLLKQYLRELPESIFPPSLYEEIVKSAEWSDEEWYIKFYDTVCLFPPVNRQVLKAFFELLQYISSVEIEATKMNEENLAVCIGPNIIYSPEDHPLVDLANLGAVTTVLKRCIRNPQVFEITVD